MMTYTRRLPKRLLNNPVIVIFAVVNLVLAVITIVTLGTLFMHPVPETVI